MAQTSQAHEWAKALGMHAGFVEPALPPPPDPPESPDQSSVRMGIGLLSRWPIAECRPEVMPSRHRTPSPVLLTASVQHPAGPLHLMAACLEWEPAYNDDRMAQARARVTYLRLEVVGPRMIFVVGDVDLTGDDAESHVAVRLRALEAKISASPAVAGAVLSLSAPDEPALEA